jgi:autoinducer 2-degrading protein
MTDTSQLTAFCVHLNVLKGKEAAFLAASQANQAGARKEPGNLRFDIYRLAGDPQRFVFVEAYDSVESVTRHRETEHFATWLSAADGMLAEPRVRVPGTTAPEGYVRVEPSR